MKYGVKSVTMDDIARNLGISKKTLYKYVKDKNDLVVKVMASSQQFDVMAIEAICGKKLNAIDENYEISKFVLQKLNGIHPSIFFDLEKYYPKAWQIFEEHKNSFIHQCVCNNIERGMEEGLYRSDIRPQLMSLLYVRMMDMLFRMYSEHPEMRMSLNDMYLEVFRYHIRGIASEKGLEYLKMKIKKEHY